MVCGQAVPRPTRCPTTSSSGTGPADGNSAVRDNLTPRESLPGPSRTRAAPSGRLPKTAHRADPVGSAGNLGVRGTEPRSSPSQDHPPPGPSQRPATGGFSCEDCGKEYSLRSSLQRHKKTCGDNSRRKCIFCKASFPDFKAVRQHERRAHPLEYRKDLEDKLPAPETLLMAKIAKIEAESRRGVINYKHMERATGLTQHQIRYRREKSVYKTFLEQAKKELRDESAKKFRPISSSSSEASVSSLAPLDGNIPPTSGSSARLSIGATTSLDAVADISLSPVFVGAKRKPSASPQEEPPSTRRKTTAPATPPAAPWQEEARALPPQTPRDDIKTRQGHDRNPKRKRSKSSSPESPIAISTLRPCEAIPPITPAIMSPAPPTTSFSTQPPDATPVQQATPVQLEAPMPGASRGTPLAAEQAEDGIGGRSNRPAETRGEFLRALEGAKEGADEATLRLISAGLTASDAELDHSLCEWLALALPSNRPPQRPRNRSEPSTNIPPANRRSQRASNYKKCQDLYRRNRATLAQKILEGKPLHEETATPTVDQVENLYKNLFESVPEPVSEPLVAPAKTVGTYNPITEDEVEFGKRGWPCSAPGPDGVTVDQVRRCPARLLAALYNVLLYRKTTPSSWRESRTVLLPKEGDLTDPGNWRPITIGPAAQRLLHRILARRISTSVQLHVQQRGFSPVDGTLANTLMLHHYIQSRRLQGKSYNVASMDVRKAFDSVSHPSVRRALRRLGIEEPLIQYIMDSMRAHTTIHVGRSSTNRIYFRRGVRQGDPLSPILFNAVLDELLVRLNEQLQRLGGTLCPGLRIAAIAFADDLVLLADRDIDMTLLLDEAVRFLGLHGMVVNPKKCVAIAAATSQGVSVPRTKPIFKILGEYIRPAHEVNVFRYLGLGYNTSGAAKPCLANLVLWLRNLERAPLKPDQKLVMLRQHLIPRLYHGFQTPRITAKMLTEANRLIRKSARKFLHLNTHTGDQFIHAKLRDGGLGIPDLRHKIPLIMRARIENLEASDSTFGKLIPHMPTSSLCARLGRITNYGDPDAYWREEISTRPTSKGLESASDNRASRDWLAHTPRGWTGRDFVRAVQLRTGNLPCLGLPTTPANERQCRAGCPRVESIAHILQTCPVVHDARIRRHDQIVKRVAQETRRAGLTTEVEPHIRHQDGRLYKPDLVVHLPNRVDKASPKRIVVCDVQVSWEGPRPLSDTWTRKQLVYDHAHFKEAMWKKWPGTDITCLPLIVGARGIWPRANNPTVEALQLPQRLAYSAVNGVLKWGASMHRMFMASVWRRARPPRQRDPRLPPR